MRWRCGRPRWSQARPAGHGRRRAVMHPALADTAVPFMTALSAGTASSRTQLHSFPMSRRKVLAKLLRPRATGLAIAVAGPTGHSTAVLHVVNSAKSGPAVGTPTGSACCRPLRGASCPQAPSHHRVGAPLPAGAWKPRPALGAGAGSLARPSAGGDTPSTMHARSAPTAGGALLHSWCGLGSGAALPSQPGGTR